MNSPFHVLASEQFDKKFLDHFFLLTDAVRRFDKTREGLLYLQGLLAEKRAMLYFTQPSTRTFLSFQSALHILGIKTSEIRDPSTSSERKGESIEDSLRTFSSYVDTIIMRSPVPGLCDRVAKILDETSRPVPIVNAGSGPDQHPTQALLDMYTLFRSFRNRGGLENKTIAMVGDLKRGRTVRSLCQLLNNYHGNKILLVSPEQFRMEKSFLQDLRRNDQNSFEETERFDDAISCADAVYMTRVQDEYDQENESKKVDSSNFHFKKHHLDILGKDSIIMHPMPRREEIESNVDVDPRAKYWRQERNGMWTRVALLTRIFGVDHQILMPEL